MAEIVRQVKKKLSSEIVEFLAIDSFGSLSAVSLDSAEQEVTPFWGAKKNATTAEILANHAEMRSHLSAVRA